MKKQNKDYWQQYSSTSDVLNKSEKSQRLTLVCLFWAPRNIVVQHGRLRGRGPTVYTDSLFSSDYANENNSLAYYLSNMTLEGVL